MAAPLVPCTAVVSINNITSTAVVVISAVILQRVQVRASPPPPCARDRRSTGSSWTTRCVSFYFVDVQKHVHQPSHIQPRQTKEIILLIISCVRVQVSYHIYVFYNINVECTCVPRSE